MKTAKELYPQEDDYFSASSYQPILNNLGKIIIQVDDKDWQGDSRVIYKDGNKFGYLQFGWGSCSGCDALQACHSIEEVQELMESLNNRIKWFENSAKILDYFKTHDWELEYCWHSEEQKEFIEKVIKYMEENNGTN
jgi:hypothetical protein